MLSLKSALLIMLFILGPSSCHYPYKAKVSGDPVIRYGTLSGWSGENSIISVFPDGHAVRHGHPELSTKLSEDQFTRLIGLFDGFDSLSNSYRSGWEDDVNHNIEFSWRGKTKSVLIEAGVRERVGTRGTVQLFRITDALSQLADSICRTELPWKGIAVSFSTDKIVYGPGQPIRLTYTISNPTTQKRVLFFPPKFPRYEFNIGRENMNYSYPKDLLVEDLEPSELELEPGEEKQIIHSVDLHEVFDADLLRGDYSTFMKLGVGECGDSYQTLNRIPFELGDSSMPIGGRVEVDTSGSNGDPMEYVLSLVVQNWTVMPVHLHFAQDKQLGLSLSLYRGKKVPFHQDSIVSDGRPGDIVLMPNELRRFSRTLNVDIAQHMRDLKMSSNVVVAEVTLLSDMYSFTREKTIYLPNGLWKRTRKG